MMRLKEEQHLKSELSYNLKLIKGIEDRNVFYYGSVVHVIANKLVEESKSQIVQESQMVSEVRRKFKELQMKRVQLDEHKHKMELENLLS